MDEDKVGCPKCGSTQIHAGKRGWNIRSGLRGMNQIVLTCLECGQVFASGQGQGRDEGMSTEPGATRSRASQVFFLCFGLLCVYGGYGLYTDLARLEREGGSIHIHWAAAAIYELLGKEVLAALIGLFGILVILFLVVAPLMEKRR
jgi:ribosomal protein S27E